MATTPASKGDPQKQLKSVTFIVEEEGAKEVIVTGDFTKWAADKVRLAKSQDGKWRAVIALTPGEHQYRLRVDGQWKDHSAAPKRVPNAFGTENCVVTVS